jgi:meiotically up-regulated gene 157 (Mug157) protein
MAYESRRPPQAERRFSSRAVEQVIARVGGQVADPEIAWLFANCYPNTLDTAVSVARDAAGRDDTFVITGDIPTMWLRDSTAQVWPYLPLLRDDEPLRQLVRGVINRQAACVLLDPYANSFLRSAGEQSEWRGDHTEMRSGVHERKYSLDSLCSVLRLSTGYYRACGDASCFDATWRKSVELILQTLRVEQRGSDDPSPSPYRFARTARRGTDTQPLSEGRPYPFRQCGLTRSPFRPSDDACQLAFPVAANAMAVVCLRDLAAIGPEVGLPAAVAASAVELANEIDAGIRQFGVRQHPAHGEIYAYEVDGFGSSVFMDDANIPSLLGLPYLRYCEKTDPLYQRTRRYVLSADNAFYSDGAAGRGVGGPHIGPGWIWPMSITMQALTSDDDDEIRQCLRLLKSSHAGTGFMHESFWKDDASQFTRPWFAWANTLFGELILTLSANRPHLLR